MLGGSWSDVGHVVLTHHHGDHVGGLAEVIAKAPGATPYGGEADLASIQSTAPMQAVGDGDEVRGLDVRYVQFSRVTTTSNRSELSLKSPFPVSLNQNRSFPATSTSRN